jgi:phosphoribosylaminoimidazole-succinocarboxamide synthase
MAIGFQQQKRQSAHGFKNHAVHNGSSKIIYNGLQPGTYVLCFKDSLNAETTVQGRGAVNNRLSELLMTRLSDMGIQTHFIKRLNMHEQLVRVAEPLPFHVQVYNVASGTFAKRMGLEEGTLLQDYMVELHTAPVDGQTLLSDRHVTTLGLATPEELDIIYQTTQRIHDFLNGQFLALGIRLLTYRLEFGRFYLSEMSDESHLILIDELSTHTFQLLDIRTQDRLDTNGPQVHFEAAHLHCQTLAARFGLLEPGGPADLLD